MAKSPRTGANKDDGVLTYRALYDFNAEDSDQLSINKGDLIKVKKQNDLGDGWLEASFNGRTGLVPETYIEQVADSIKRTSKGRKDQKDNLIISACEPNYEVPSDDLGEIAYQALFDYKARTQREISIKYGDELEVDMSKQAGVSKGWLHGSNKGKTGLFPENYVVQMSSQLNTSNTEDDDDENYIVPIATASDISQYAMAKHRHEAIDKLCSTVSSYCKYLEDKKKHYFEPHLGKRSSFEEDWKRVSENWDMLIAKCRELNNALRTNRMAAKANPNRMSIGDTLKLQLHHLMKVTQCFHWEKDAEVISQKALQRQPSLIGTLTKATDMKPPDMDDLKMIMKIPNEHINGYPDLIRKIVENTPSDHKDYDRIQVALTETIKICEEIDKRSEEMKDLDDMKRVQEIVRCTNMKFTSPTDGLGPRKLICTTLLTQIHNGQDTPSAMFLMNDILLLTHLQKMIKDLDPLMYMKSDAKIFFQLARPPMELNKLEVLRLPELDPTLFHLLYMDGAEYSVISLRTGTATDRKMWTTKIVEAALEYTGAKRDISVSRNQKSTEAATQMYKAMFQFETDNPEALTLSPGDVIKVGELQEGASPGWTFGSCGDHSGWFPSGYVEYIKDIPVVPTAKMNFPRKVDGPSPDRESRCIAGDPNARFRRRTNPTRMPNSDLPPPVPPRIREAKDMHR